MPPYSEKCDEYIEIHNYWVHPTLKFLNLIGPWKISTPKTIISVTTIGQPKRFRLAITSMPCGSNLRCCGDVRAVEHVVEAPSLAHPRAHLLEAGWRSMEAPQDGLDRLKIRIVGGRPPLAAGNIRRGQGGNGCKNKRKQKEKQALHEC